ncbi:hypothetical protein ACQPZF_17015 [Actinosynnema sp. CS-041913]|uniref:hypothetical protein n=1 Tax=Actinosynnema sp. CS-041913 TaxID=3239917 RepID=UPI003D8DF97E
MAPGHAGEVGMDAAGAGLRVPIDKDGVSPPCAWNSVDERGMVIGHRLWDA